MNDPVPPALLTEKQTCEYLNVSRSFLAKSRMDGTRPEHTPAPPYIRLGKAIRYAIEDLDKYISEQRQQVRTVDGGSQ